MARRRQTTINPHLSPPSSSSRIANNNLHSSSATRTTNTASPDDTRRHRQSSGSEDIDDVQLSQAPSRLRPGSLVQQRSQNRAVYDSDDDFENETIICGREEEEDDEPDFLILDAPPGSFDVDSSPAKSSVSIPPPRSKRSQGSDEQKPLAAESSTSASRVVRKGRRPVVVSDEDTPSQAGSRKLGRGQSIANRDPSSAVIRSKKRVAALDDSDPSETEDVVGPTRRTTRKAVSASKPRARPFKKRRSAAQDPDEVEGAITDHDDEDDLKMDEPERFKTKSRLRPKKETDWQRKLRKMKNKRLGIAESSTEEDSDSEAESSEGTSNASANSADFIEDDGGEVRDGLLPHQFSLNSTQTPEFKFKVCFHYFVLLVIRGPKILPLRGEAAEYFMPYLLDMRRMIIGYRDSRVRSQIWRADLVRSLQKFPELEATYLVHAHVGCDACHASGRLSKYRVRLEGYPYDPDTHEPIETDSEEESDRFGRERIKARNQVRQRRQRSESSEVSSEESEEELPRSFFMGTNCRARAGVYHSMSHWEDDLYYCVRDVYRDLLRAKHLPVPSDSEASSSDHDSNDEDEIEGKKRQLEQRRQATGVRVAALRRGGLPESVKDVDTITEWMDKKGYQSKAFQWFNGLVTSSERLEHDTSTDD